MGSTSQPLLTLVAVPFLPILLSAEAQGHSLWK